MNPEWREEWGGALELQQNPWLPEGEGEKRVVVPLANRCVLFETTESSWHGFRRITLPEDSRALSRRSIAVYFYTEERPREESAPSHGIVYVPRPLPGHLHAGHTLTPADMWQLEVLMQRRDTQIQYLYERELEFQRIAQSPTYRLARLLAWPLRKLRAMLLGGIR